MSDADAKYSQYKVPPFSGKNYRDNACEAPEGTMPCAICGKPTVMAKARHWGIVINGGRDWGDLDSPEDGGHMGCFPVGSDCHKKHLRGNK